MEQTEQELNEDRTEILKELISTYRQTKEGYSDRKKEKKNIFSIINKKKTQAITYTQFAIIINKMYYDEDNFEEFSKNVKEKGLPDKNPDPDHELISFNEGNEVEFDLKDSKNLKEVELLSFFTLPSFFSFGLSNYQEYSEVAFKYILNSIPCPTKAFYVQNKTETIEDCTPIFLSLTCAASYCTEYFSLNYLKISCSQFCSLIKAAKRAENIRLAYCAIITDTECDFGKMEGTKVRKLNFAWSDHQYNNFDNNRIYNEKESFCKSFAKILLKLKS